MIEYVDCKEDAGDVKKASLASGCAVFPRGALRGSDYRNLSVMNRCFQFKYRKI
jgi:hypothetical protein